MVPPVVSTKIKPHGRRGWWLSLGAAGVLAVLAIGYWYLRRPLPPPRITGYDQITNDGMQKGRLGGTDGNRLYLSLAQPQAIAQMPTSGGPLAQIPMDLPALSVRDVSPDGSSLLGCVYLGTDGRDTELWVVGILGHPIRHLVQALDAGWSPNGQFVTYAFLGNIYSMIIPLAIPLCGYSGLCSFALLQDSFRRSIDRSCPGTGTWGHSKWHSD
jgi:hypothetical protein